MPPTAFASSTALSRSQLQAARIHYPHPSELAKELRLEGRKAEQAARALGLHTIGDLLEHLPRDRREARTVAELVAGESATVLVEVRSIASRPVRRRGMRPLVEATVGDASGMMKATFFNQPWLVHRYPAGTRVALHGKFQARNRFRVQAHASTSEVGASQGEVAHYPATEGLSSTQILATVREHERAFGAVIEPLPGRSRSRLRLAERPAALRAAHFPRRAVDQEQARHRLAFDELLLLQLALLRRRTARRHDLRAPVLDEPALSSHQKMIADKLTVSELMTVAMIALPPIAKVTLSLTSQSKSISVEHRSDGLYLRSMMPADLCPEHCKTH